MASHVLVSISRDEKERARLVSEYKFALDQQSKMVEARRDGLRKGRREGMQKGRREGMLKGKQEGLQEGVLKGRQEGLQEGVLKGRQEGLLEGAREIARGLKAMGIPVDEIASATRLSPDEIAAL
jgi:predicted transposase YdaD